MAYHVPVGHEGPNRSCYSGGGLQHGARVCDDARHLGNGYLIWPEKTSNNGFWLLDVESTTICVRLPAFKT